MHHLKTYKWIYYVLTVLIILTSIFLFVAGDVVASLDDREILGVIILVLLMSTIETSIGIKLDCNQNN